MRNLLIILFLFIGLQAHATTYYVAPDGSGDNGAAGGIATPWATLAFAVDEVSSGDTIYMQTGTHTINSRVDVPVGISLIGAGETSIISSTITTTYYTTIRFYSSSEGTEGNQTISYLKFDGNDTAYSAMEIMARSNVEVHHCTFIDFYNMGFSMNGTSTFGSSAPTTYATGNKIYSNTVTDCANFDSNGYGNIQFGGQDGILIYDNVSTSNERATHRNGYPLKFCGGGFSKGFKIYDNTLITAQEADSEPFYGFAIELWHTQGGAEIYDNDMTGGIDFGGGYTMVCLIKGDYDYGAWVHNNTIGGTTYPGTTTGIYLERNTEYAIIEKNIFRNLYNGITVSPTTGETMQHHDFRYNIFNNITYYCFRYAYASTSGAIAQYINYYNNVIYMAASGSLVGIGVPTMGTTKCINIKNNIIMNAGYAAILASGAGGQTLDSINISNNIMYNNGFSNLPRMIDLTPTHYTNENNISDDNPDFTTPGSDFTLKTGAPGIDAGIGVGLNYDIVEYPVGVTPEIGAYEVQNLTATDITTFTVTNIIPPAVINTTAHTVVAQVDFGTGLTTLSPVIGVSSGATIDPVSGTERDFTGALTYTVTAQDGVTDQIWTVTLTEVAPTTNTDILTYTFPEETETATIDNVAHTVAIEVTNGTDVTTSTPTITLYTDATIDPLSGVEDDFTSPVVYTVTAQDAVTTQEWTTTVTVAAGITLPVVTTSLTSNTSISAIVAGNVTSAGGGTVSARGVCWGTSSNPAITDNIVPSASGTGSYSCTLTGLSNSTVYYVRAYAINEAGTSYGAQESFTTNAAGGVTRGSKIIKRGTKAIYVN